MPKKGWATRTKSVDILAREMIDASSNRRLRDHQGLRTTSHRPTIRHSREGGNPRTTAPSQNGDRETRKHPPSRLSGDRKHAPYPDTGPEPRWRGTSPTLSQTTGL